MKIGTQTHNGNELQLFAIEYKQMNFILIQNTIISIHESYR